MKTTEVDALLATHADATIKAVEAVPGPHTAATVAALKAGKGKDPCAEVLCSQPLADGYLFAAAVLKSGKHVAVYAGHSAEFATLAELKESLNQQERTLLAYGVKR